jgi:4-hydroxy-3-methylbut-2-en-1-yl diphosphate reductase
MELKIAKNAGFCFGVKRAMKVAWDELEKSDGDIYALGPLIHNKQAVLKYEENGLKTINEVNDVPKSNSMIIRSHGVGEGVYIESEKKGLNVIDTTCPFVKKIHEIAKRHYVEGYKIIVIGDSKHPEVIGINGWCNNEAIVIKTLDDLENTSFEKSDKYCIVAQTTINVDLYQKIVEALSNKIDDVIFNNTICSATKVRQESAKEISKEVDMMVVVGGKHSSNTQKLVQICEEHVPTLAIETVEELNEEDFKGYNVVGLTAGASTPDWIIEEVINYIKAL